MTSRGRSIIFSIAEWFGAFLIACIVLFFLHTFVIEAYRVPSGSMETTIEAGDMLFGEKVSLNLGMDVSAGDIVVFKSTVDDPEHEYLVKRVIATEGQTVDLRYGRVYVDGVALDEPYATGSSYPLADQATGVRVSFPYTVPEGCVWVMGDNRENSADSRYFGAVPEENLVAVIFMRYWPLDRFGSVD